VWPVHITHGAPEALAAAAARADPPALTRAELGAIAVYLASTFPVWIRRRKTAFEFVDDTVVRTKQSIDFRLRAEDFPNGAVPAEGARIYVPINIAPKEPLTSFSIRDEDDRSLSLLNTFENGELAAEGLSAFMDGQTATNPGIVRGYFKPALSKIVYASDKAAGELALHSAIGHMGSALKDDAIIRPLLTELTGGFLMLVPISYRPDEARVLKIDFVAPFEFSQRGLGGWLRAAAASVGLAPKTLQFQSRPIGWAEGSHFEFAQPDEVRLISARLAVRQFNPKTRTHESIRNRRIVYGKPRMDLNASVWDPKAPNTGREDTADVVLQMRPQAVGTFLNITMTAVLSASLLGFFATRLQQLDEPTTAAVLLVIPALLFGYLARPGEHAIATRLLAGVRVLGLIAALAAISGAALIGSGEFHASATVTRDQLDPT
jgi:hypothetical protein